jgi:type I restriction enzyme S subunit
MSNATTHIETEKQLVPALRFKEFEGGFQKKKVGDIAELTSSKRVYLNDYVDVGIPFYRGKEISELRSGKTPDDILYITESSYNEFRSKYGVPQKDDILITAVGTVGNVLRIKNDDKFYFKDGNLIWFRKIKENSSYLEIALEYYKRAIDKTSIGSTQRALTMVELRKLKFPFPSLSEQQKIAFFLSLVDEKIQQLTKKNALLEQYKKGVMQQLFSGQLRFKDENGNPYPDWEEKRLNELVLNHNSGIYKDKKLYGNGVNIIGVSDLYRIDFIDGQEFKRVKLDADELEKCSLNKGDLIYGESSLVRSGIAKTLSVTKKGEGTCFAWHTRRYSVDQSIINSTFLYYQINAPICRRFIESVATQTALTGITTKEYFKTPISIPFKEEQQKVATYLSRIDTKIESVTHQITQTQTFKKGLLQKMFV